MVILDTVHLAYSALGIQHLPAFPVGITVQMCGEDLLVCFISIQDIADAHVQSALPGEDLGNGHLSFRQLVHQLIYLIQQIQPMSGVLWSGDARVDAAGDLVDVVTDVMDLGSKFTDLP